MNSSILDVAIGVAFVFLLVSTICSAVREAIEHALKTRASYLEYSIRELLKDEQLVRAFFEHPLIQGLYQGPYTPLGNGRPSLLRRGKDLPSYIPARSFALALIDLAARGPITDAVSAAPDLFETSFASVRASVGNLGNSSVQRALLIALDSAHGDLERATKNLEVWYDGAMDRVSGWYKRSTQTVIFGVALAAALALNVNTITIADHLYRDQSLRQSVVGASSQTQQPLSYAQASGNLEQLQLPIGWAGGWGAPRNRAERESLAALHLASWREAETRAALDHQAPSAEALAEQRQLIEAGLASPWNQLFAPLLGLLITALAATLGAPFWFDILNKVMVIRATVKPHEKSPEEGSEDRQPRQPARAPPALQTTERPAPATTQLPEQAPSNDQHDPHEDGCGEPMTDPTPDEELPPARGGVG